MSASCRRMWFPPLTSCLPHHLCSRFLGPVLLAALPRAPTTPASPPPSNLQEVAHPALHSPPSLPSHAPRSPTHHPPYLHGRARVSSLSCHLRAPRLSFRVGPLLSLRPCVSRLLDYIRSFFSALTLVFRVGFLPQPLSFAQGFSRAAATTATTTTEVGVPIVNACRQRSHSAAS